jgi:hypothetical protein
MGCFFSIESVWLFGPPGGGIGTTFNLLLKGARNGELEDWCAGLCGEQLLVPDAGGWNTIFLLEETFLIGFSGDDGFELLCIDGIGA